MAVVCLLSVSPLVASCSSSGSEGVQAQSIAAPPKELITARDIARTRPGSATRTFLLYWSALQFSAWSAALEFYEPGLLRAIGTDLLVEALKSQSSYFPTVRPELMPSMRVRSQTIVRYVIPTPARQTQPGSVAWRQTGGRWLIHYQPQLDGFLQAYEQARVQSKIDPNAAQPSKAALLAGAAAYRLQSAYVKSTRR